MGVFRYYMPDEEDRAMVNELTAKYPDAMPYFFTQHPDYITVKERVSKHTVDGSEAEGIATLDVAVATLSVAEYLTPILQEQQPMMYWEGGIVGGVKTMDVKRVKNVRVVPSVV